MYGVPQAALGPKFKGSINEPLKFEAPRDFLDPMETVRYIVKVYQKLYAYVETRQWGFEDPYVWTAAQWTTFINNLEAIATHPIRTKTMDRLPAETRDSIKRSYDLFVQNLVLPSIEKAKYSKELVESEDRIQAIAKEIQAKQAERSSTWFWVLSVSTLAAFGVLYYRRRQREKANA